MNTGITALTGWSVSASRLIRTGNVVSAFVQFARTGAAITVNPTSGDFTNQSVAQITDSRFFLRVAEAGNDYATLTSSAVGRGAFGHLNSDNIFRLVAVNGTATLATGDELSLGGTFVTN